MNYEEAENLASEKSCKISSVEGTPCTLEAGDKVTYKNKNHWIIWTKSDKDTNICTEYGLTDSEDNATTFLFLGDLQNDEEIKTQFGNIIAKATDVVKKTTGGSYTRKPANRKPHNRTRKLKRNTSGLKQNK